MARADYNNPVSAIVDGINAMDSSRKTVGGVKYAQFKGQTGRHYDINGSVMITLDKKTYPKVTNTQLERYKHIPESGRAVLSNVANYMVYDIIPQAFDDESSPEGVPWEGLSERTMKWRKWLNAEDAPILDVSGSLRGALYDIDNLVTIDIRVGKYARLILSPHGLPNNPRHGSSGNERIKFYVHGLGSADGLIPARPFMPSDSTQLAEKHKREIRRRVKEGYNDYLSGKPGARPRPKGKK